MSMRKLFSLFPVLAASISLLPAAPSLTTIQDILYKADGTRFNGVINIQWNNFQAADASIVATQSLTIQIVNGVLQVQLVPTTNASAGANYQVVYSSAGQYQFTETWAVPPSTVPLQVKDVRVSSGSTVGGGTTTVSGQVQISDVQGLSNELLTRPIEGTNFSPGRAAVINSAGQIDAVTGNVNDCVLVDGSSAPCGGVGDGSSNIAYSDAETPVGAVNGSNPTFTLAFTPAPSLSLILYVNGLYMSPNVDYTLSGGTITFLAPSVPQTGDLLTASYRYSPPREISDLQTGGAPQVLCNGIGSSTAASTQQILASCNIAANALVAGDRVEIKFGMTHHGTTTGFNPAIYWGSTGLVLRAMTASDTALVGEANITVPASGSMTHFTTSSASGGLPLITSGTASGTVQNPNTVAFDASLNASGTQDSVSLVFFIVTRYPAPQ